MGNHNNCLSLFSVDIGYLFINIFGKVFCIFASSSKTENIVILISKVHRSIEIKKVEKNKSNKTFWNRITFKKKENIHKS